MKKTPKVIAYVIPGLGISGGIGVALRHVFELTKSGHKALVFVTNTERIPSWHPLQNKVKIFPLSAYYEETGPDGADFLVATWWETAFAIAPLRAGQKCFLVQGLEHLFYSTTDPKRAGFLMALALGYRTMTVAKWIQTWLGENFRIKAEYVPNGLEESILRPANALPREQHPKLRVLIEGPSALPFKRIPEAFEVVRDLDVEVWYVNSGGKVRRDWKISRYFEKLPMESMAQVYRQCDVILKMCAIESFSLPVAEMLATGGTAIVTDGPGFREYGKHEKNLLIARDTSVQAARGELIKLIGNPALMQRLRSNAAKSVAQFTWSRTARNLEIFFSTRTTPQHHQAPEIIDALSGLYADMKYRDFYHKVRLSGFLNWIAKIGYAAKKILQKFTGRGT